MPGRYVDDDIDDVEQEIAQLEELLKQPMGVSIQGQRITRLGEIKKQLAELMQKRDSGNYTRRGE